MKGRRFKGVGVEAEDGVGCCARDVGGLFGEGSDGRAPIWFRLLWCGVGSVGVVLVLISDELEESDRNDEFVLIPARDEGRTSIELRSEVDKGVCGGEEAHDGL